MFRKLKIDFKKCMACLLATLQIQAMSGCMSNNNNIDKSTESEKTEEYIQNAFESASERSEQIRTSEDPNLMLYKTYAYVSEEYKNLNGKRYVWVKVNNNDQYVGLFNLETLNEDIPCNTFDVINDEFHEYNTGTYRWLSVPDDNDYKCGLYDTTNSNLIIPCKTYTEIYYYEESGIYQCIKPDGTADTFQLSFIDFIDEEKYVQKAFESASERSEQIRTSKDPNLMLYKTYAYVSEEYKNLNGKRYVWVKVNNNDQYKGLFNLETLNEDIPCNTFDKIKDEFQAYNTGTYRWISIPGDSGYICGLYDTTNSNLIIPCKTYTDYTYYEESGIYQCIKPDGTADTIQLPFIENKYEKEENPEVEIGVNTNESIISREAAVSLFYKDGNINVDAVSEEPISFWILGNNNIITYEKELCMITKNGINYLVDPHDYSQVVFSGYDDTKNIAAPNELDYVVYQSDIWAFKIYGKDGKGYYVDPYDMTKPILSGIDLNDDDQPSIREVYFPGYTSIRDNGDGTFKKKNYCCEIIKNGVKYLTDLFDFTKILASGYENFDYDEVDGIQRMILTYPDGSIEIYNSDALNIINSDVLVTNSSMEKDFSLSLTK